MNAREIKNIQKEIKLYEMPLNSKGLTHAQLINLFRAYTKLAELDDARRKDSFEKALKYLNKAISLDGDDYDPSRVADRAEILIKIDEYKLTDQIQDANDIYNQLKRDKKLLENGAHKVKDLDSIIVGSAIKKVNNFITIESRTENNTLDIYRKLGIEESAKATSVNQTFTHESYTLESYEELRSENQTLKKEIESLKAQNLVLQEENKRLTQSTLNKITEINDSLFLPSRNKF